jgi:hypothetical protein
LFLSTGRKTVNDESEDPRWVGRDEMNLCEFPITLLTERVPPGCKTMVFEDRHGRDYGLPAAGDSDVIVALLHLTKSRNDRYPFRVGDRPISGGFLGGQHDSSF